jgi:hypothetical protein
MVKNTIPGTSDVYDDFVRLLFFHTHREASILTG